MRNNTNMNKHAALIGEVGILLSRLSEAMEDDLVLSNYVHGLEAFDYDVSDVAGEFSALSNAFANDKEDLGVFEAGKKYVRPGLFDPSWIVTCAFRTDTIVAFTEDDTDDVFTPYEIELDDEGHEVCTVWEYNNHSGIVSSLLTIGSEQSEYTPAPYRDAEDTFLAGEEAYEIGLDD